VRATRINRIQSMYVKRSQRDIIIFVKR